MMLFRLLPATRRGWQAFGIRWAAIAAGVIVLAVFMTAMPGKPHQGPPGPLSAEEATLRESLRSHVVALSESIGPRSVWHYGALRKAEEYIAEELRAAGLDPVRQPFMAGGRDVANIEAVIPGRTEECVVVGAHYDTEDSGKGANDNASGVAALLETARRVPKSGMKRTLRLVAFVNEEPPFFQTEEMGSLVYARGLKRAGVRVHGMYSLETIGCYLHGKGTQQYPFPLGLFYPNEGNFIAFVGNLSSRAWVARSVKAFRSATRFPSEATAAPGWIMGIGWSDQWSFWKCGYRALMITDTAPFRYAHYHTLQDTWEKLNYDEMARVVAGVVQVAREICEQ